MQCPICCPKWKSANILLSFCGESGVGAVPGQAVMQQSVVREEGAEHRSEAVDLQVLLHGHEP